MDRKIQLIKVNDPFNRSDKEVSLLEYNGESLLSLRDTHFPKDSDVVVSVNGQVIPKEFLECSYVREGDCVVFMPVLEGGKSGEILRTVAFIALAVAAAYLAPQLALMALKGATAAAGTLSYAVGEAIYWGV